MGDDATLMQGAQRYLAALSDADRISQQAEVERFVRWCGADRAFSQVRGQEVANYGDTLGGGVSDAGERADAVRQFLSYISKEGMSPSNLAVHLRLKKSSSNKARVATLQVIEMTADEKVTLEAELESLKGQRPRIREDLKRAMADKDFRENAPLDAARQEQAYTEGRIRELEATLDRAEVIEGGDRPTGDMVDIGSTVMLRNLKSGAETRYTLVRPGEAKAAEGRISFESPVGRALLGHRVGNEVEVAAPSGAIRLRIEGIEQ